MRASGLLASRPLTNRLRKPRKSLPILAKIAIALSLSFIGVAPNTAELQENSNHSKSKQTIKAFQHILPEQSAVLSARARPGFFAKSRSFGAFQ
jgi:hypothetical protein